MARGLSSSGGMGDAHEGHGSSQGTAASREKCSCGSTGGCTQGRTALAGQGPQSTMPCAGRRTRPLAEHGILEALIRDPGAGSAQQFESAMAQAPSPTLASYKAGVQAARGGRGGQDPRRRKRRALGAAKELYVQRAQRRLGLGVIHDERNVGLGGALAHHLHNRASGQRLGGRCMCARTGGCALEPAPRHTSRARWVQGQVAGLRNHSPASACGRHGRLLHCRTCTVTSSRLSTRKVRSRMVEVRCTLQMSEMMAMPRRYCACGGEGDGRAHGASLSRPAPSKAPEAASVGVTRGRVRSARTAQAAGSESLAGCTGSESLAGCTDGPAAAPACPAAPICGPKVLSSHPCPYPPWRCPQSRS